MGAFSTNKAWKRSINSGLMLLLYFPRELAEGRDGRGFDEGRVGSCKVEQDVACGDKCGEVLGEGLKLFDEK